MKLRPGRDMDALVAEKVMGYSKEFSLRLTDPDKHFPTKYSTSIEAAWEVVEKLDLPFELNSDDEHTLWNARFNLDRGNWSQASTAPHAICLAALKSLGVEV